MLLLLLFYGVVMAGSLWVARFVRRSRPTWGRARIALVASLPLPLVIGAGVVLLMAVAVESQQTFMFALLGWVVLLLPAFLLSACICALLVRPPSPSVETANLRDVFR